MEVLRFDFCSINLVWCSIDTTKKRSEHRNTSEQNRKNSTKKMLKQTVENFLFVVSWIVCLAMAEQPSKPCMARRMDGNSIVCVCDAIYCDTLDTPVPMERNDFVLVTSSMGDDDNDGDRFNFTVGKFPRRDRHPSVPAPIDVSKAYVKIKGIISGREFLGWGGTYTGSTAYVTSLMSTRMQRHVFKSFYSPDNGTNLSIVRVPIGSTANDLKQWTYNEYPVNDSRLANFSAFNREDRIRLCQLKQLKRIAKNPSIEFMAVASRAPEWMTRSILNGKRNILKREFYQTWADYHLKFLQMMDDECIRFLSISTGQRPVSLYNESSAYSTLEWNPFEQGKWLANHFGPTLRASNFSDITIVAYDDSRQSIPYYASAMNVGDQNAMRFVDAIGIQNYKNKYFLPTVLDSTYYTFPSKIILNTEISFPDVELGSWNNAEALAIDIIKNLQHDSCGYIINNLVLNSDGGPSVTGGKQDAPILLSDDSTEFYKQPMYYVLAHFSKYITPGSMLLDTYTDKSAAVLTVAHLRPDDKIVVSLYNRLDKLVTVALTDLYQGAVELQLKPKSMNTLIY